MEPILTAAEADALFERQWQDNVFETLIEAIYTTVLRPGDAAVDGGAHVGMHTLPMARLVGDKGAVYAFEPIPALAGTVVYESRKLPQVKVMNMALGDTDGMVTFHLLTDEPWLSSVDDRGFAERGKRTEKITVQSYRLDDLADQPVRFIKLDLESGEYRALLGGQNLLKAQRPVIVFECGRADAAKAANYTQDEFFQFFSGLDYSLFDIFGRPFSPDDFGRDYNDRFVPHYLIGLPRIDDGMIDGARKRARAASLVAA